MAEQLKSTDLLSPDAIKVELLKTKVGICFSAAAMTIGVVFLFVALNTDNKELQAWATGLISLVVGAAIGFIFRQ